MIRINGKSLETEDGTIEFEFDIRRAIEKEGVIYVVLSIPMGEAHQDYIQNVFAVSNGKIKWQVEDLNTVYRGGGSLPFVNIRITDNGSIIGVDFYGRRYLIHQYDGRIIEQISSVK